MNKIYIQKATLEDVEAIAQVHVKSWQESYKDILAPSYLNNIPHEDRLKLRKEVLSSSEAGIHLVAKNENAIIGFCDAGPNREQLDASGEIYAIYLLESYKDKGIGTKLWIHAVNYLKENKLYPFTAWVLEKNIPARKFYEKKKGYIIDTQMTAIGEEQHKEVCYIFNELSG